MSQLGKVKNDLHVRTGGLSLGRRGGGGGFVERNGSVQPKPLTSVLSPSTRGEAERLDQGWCESRKLWKLNIQRPPCVATGLRAGAVACAVLSAAIEAAHKLR
jgi:hypothetical protein